MKAINLNLPIEPYKITLHPIKDFWVSNNGIVLRIKQNPKEKYQFEVVEKDILLNNVNNQDLIHSFLNEYIRQEKETINTEASGFDTDEEETYVEKPDFDPEQVRIENKRYDIDLVGKLIDNKKLDIAPDFHRNLVWGHKEKSRLIESLMLYLPIPTLFLAQDEEGLYQVVDGLQRLTAIYTFIKNKFALQDLEYLKDCENKKFENLEPKYQRRILRFVLDFSIIDSNTPFSVKLLLFERLNDRAKATKQEIRMSMAKPVTRQLLNDMVDSDFFRQATDDSVKSLRMEDQELALRFIGFYWYKITKTMNYYNDMGNLLDWVLNKLNEKNTQNDFETLKTLFQNAMQNAFHLFGKYAFRKCRKEHLQENAKKQLLNKSLFTVWSVVLSQYDHTLIKQHNTSGALNNPLAEMLEKDVDYFQGIMGEKPQFNYFDSITTGTNQITKLDFGFKIADYLVKNYIKTQ